MTVEISTAKALFRSPRVFLARSRDVGTPLSRD
jgi:hypothetical protein